MDSFAKQLKNSYEKKKKRIEEFIDPKRKYRYMFSKNLFQISDNKSEKVYLEGEYQTIGVYDARINMFYRSDCIPFIDKSEYQKVLVFLDNLKQKLEKDYNKKKLSSYEFEKYNFFIDNRDFYCSKDTIKEVINLFLEYGEFIFEIPEKNSNSKVKLVLLLDIRKI